MSLLELKNIDYAYKGTKFNVLNRISIQFEYGKVYAIQGKSGSGKSTLLSLLAGLDLCQSGSILYKGKSLKDIDRDVYRSQQIGIVFQGYNLLTNTKALENIVLSMEISKNKIRNKKEKAYQLLESVGINKEKAQRQVLKLSGGEQQRVSIARALCHDPDILIADEPTGNLDSEYENDIINILKKLAHEENKCVIIVTHSQFVASQADELWGLNRGNLVFIR